MTESKKDMIKKDVGFYSVKYISTIVLVTISQKVNKEVHRDFLYWRQLPYESDELQKAMR